MDREPERADLRISDADRSAAAERLRLAVDEGRLDVATYDERLRSAYAASTYGELQPLTADLPAATADRQPAATERAAAERRRWLEEWRSWLGGAVVLTVVWATTSLVSGELTEFWPVIPLGIWVAVLVVNALGAGHRRRGKDG
jgi:hypothetical protein